MPFFHGWFHAARLDAYRLECELFSGMDVQIDVLRHCHLESEIRSEKSPCSGFSSFGLRARTSEDISSVQAGRVWDRWFGGLLGYSSRMYQFYGWFLAGKW